MYNGMEVTEEIVEYNDGESMTVLVLSGPIPVEDMRAVFRIAEVDEGATRVMVEMSYRPKFGLLGSVMNPLMIRPSIRRLLGQVLAGLQKHLETGVLIGRGGSAVAVPPTPVTT